MGQYRITGLIGVGGMGAVYSAEHVLLERRAAVKLLLPEVSSNPEVVGRFFNEARAAAAIQHPGIVEVFDFGWTDDGAAYLVMEQLRGESLAARAARRQLPPSVVMAIARQIASALAVAHGMGIVHRDLKPDNIFLVRDSEVIGGERIKLLDFGIAKVTTGDELPRTLAGTILGTPTYMAPEQCRGMAVDHRADLYALGCVLFELCTGAPPFTGSGDGEIIAAHLHVPAPPVSSVVAGLPRALATLIDQLLSKPREQRVQSAEAVVQAMEAALREPRRGGGDRARLSTPLAARAHAVSTTAHTRLRLDWWLGAALAMPIVIAIIAMGIAGEFRVPLDKLADDAAMAAAPHLDYIDTAASKVVAAEGRSATQVAVRRSANAAAAPRAKIEDAGDRMTGAEAAPEPPPEPPTSEAVAAQYSTVGRQLTALRQRRGMAEAADLWSRYLSIQINEALVDPAKRTGCSELLHLLGDQAAERDR